MQSRRLATSFACLEQLFSAIGGSYGVAK